MCFHVLLNKIVKYVRLHRPKMASELSNCYGAGTGCGWCVPFLTKIHEQVMAGEDPKPTMSAEEYKARRAEYRQKLYGDKLPPDTPAADPPTETQ